MWYDNKDCYYSLITDNDTEIYCFYEFVKTGKLETPFRCNQEECPIMHPELIEQKKMEIKQ